MKCISVKQPWANMIARGEKTIETRLWMTKHRGQIAIASSAAPNICPAGCVVAIAEIVDCRRMTRSDEAAAGCRIYPGAWAWVLANVERIEPRPVKGQLRIYQIDLDTLGYLPADKIKGSGLFKETR